MWVFKSEERRLAFFCSFLFAKLHAKHLQKGIYSTRKNFAPNKLFPFRVKPFQEETQSMTKLHQFPFNKT